MSILLAALVGWLFACGVYLVLQRAMTRIVLGIGLLGNAAVLLLLSVGGRAGEPPFVGKDGVPEGIAAPLPQALALTAIVIGFAMIGFLLALAYRDWRWTGDDDVEDDLEDRRIRAMVVDEEGHYIDPEDEP
jgi:multicomponent Na+:H+ antiporter subunit C